MEKIFFISAQNGTSGSPFKVSLAGITYPDPNYKIYRECSEVYVAEYVSDGEGTVICGGNEYHIKKGDAYILPAGMEHNYYSDRNNPWTKKWFNVTGTLVINFYLLTALKTEYILRISRQRICSMSFLIFALVRRILTE